MSARRAPSLFERIAKVAHEAISAFRVVEGRKPLPSFERSSKHRLAAVESVGVALAGGSASDVHHVRAEAGVADPKASTETQLKESHLVHAVATTLGCGKERWDVKTGTDPNWSKVNLTPKPAQITDLIAIPAPSADPPARLDSECQVYELTGTITLAKQEADSDIHMVISDGQGHTMIIEAACPGCAQGSPVLEPITAVRQAVQQQFPGAFQGQVMSGLSVPVTVTGVAFCDRLHGQDGVAPNGIELHPVLSFKPGATP